MEIKLENHFADYEHFAKVLVHEIFTTCGLKDKLDDIEEIDWESDQGRNIWVQTSDSTYQIRTWNIYDTEDEIEIEFTLIDTISEI